MYVPIYTYYLSPSHWSHVDSLLDCVVFGRVTGVAATKYILGADVKKVEIVDSLATLCR